MKVCRKDDVSRCALLSINDSLRRHGFPKKMLD